MKVVSLTTAQQQDLARYIGELQAMSERAGADQPVDFGSIPRIVGDVCSRPVMLDPLQQADLIDLISDLTQILNDSRAGRAVTLYRSVQPSAGGCG